MNLNVTFTCLYPSAHTAVICELVTFFMPSFMLGCQVGKAVKFCSLLSAAVDLVGRILPVKNELVW